jgi:hypothetical protein
MLAPDDSRYLHPDRYVDPDTVSDAWYLSRLRRALREADARIYRSHALVHDSYVLLRRIDGAFPTRRMPHAQTSVIGSL